jgi:hypothetical protein
MAQPTSNNYGVNWQSVELDIDQLASQLGTMRISPSQSTQVTNLDRAAAYQELMQLTQRIDYTQNGLMTQIAQLMQKVSQQYINVDGTFKPEALQLLIKIGSLQKEAQQTVDQLANRIKQLTAQLVLFPVNS